MPLDCLSETIDVDAIDQARDGAGQGGVGLGSLGAARSAEIRGNCRRCLRERMGSNAFSFTPGLTESRGVDKADLGAAP